MYETMKLSKDTKDNDLTLYNKTNITRPFEMDLYIKST